MEQAKAGDIINNGRSTHVVIEVLDDGMYRLSRGGLEDPATPFIRAPHGTLEMFGYEVERVEDPEVAQERAEHQTAVEEWTISSDVAFATRWGMDAVKAVLRYLPVGGTWEWGRNE